MAENPAGGTAKRKGETLASTLVSVAIIAGATALGLQHVFAPEGVLGAYTLAGAISGTPIIVRRGDGGGNGNGRN